MTIIIDMCHALTLERLSKPVFPGQKTIIPVITTEGEEIEAYWKSRVANPTSKAVNHHCARSESIEAGKWNWLQPSLVIIPATSFREYDKNKKYHWHEIPEGMAIQGALIKDGEDNRVYIVTIPVPGEYAQYTKGRWPLLKQVGNN